MFSPPVASLSCTSTVPGCHGTRQDWWTPVRHSWSSQKRFLHSGLTVVRLISLLAVANKLEHRIIKFFVGAKTDFGFGIVDRSHIHCNIKLPRHTSESFLSFRPKRMPCQESTFAPDENSFGSSFLTPVSTFGVLPASSCEEINIVSRLLFWGEVSSSLTLSTAGPSSIFA